MLNGATVLYGSATELRATLDYDYLRTLGFDVTNDIFAENAWYFLNSLVRANLTSTSTKLDKNKLMLS